jgi:hypothetical protein
MSASIFSTRALIASSRSASWLRPLSPVSVKDDWKRHYGPVWQTVQAAKAKFDPKNVLTPGHGMFPG